MSPVASSVTIRRPLGARQEHASAGASRGLLDKTAGRVTRPTALPSRADPRSRPRLQGAGLLPWRKVIDNVMVPAIISKARPRRGARAREDLLRMVGLGRVSKIATRASFSGGNAAGASANARRWCKAGFPPVWTNPSAALDAMTRGNDLNSRASLRIMEGTSRRRSHARNPLHSRGRVPRRTGSS